MPGANQKIHYILLGLGKGKGGRGGSNKVSHEVFLHFDLMVLKWIFLESKN